MSVHIQITGLYARLAQLHRLWDKADATGQPTGPISNEIMEIQTRLAELGWKEGEGESDQTCAAAAPVGAADPR